MSHCSLFLSVLFLERSNSNDSEEPGEAMVNDLPVDPESELELKKANGGRMLSNWGYVIKSWDFVLHT